MALTHTFVINVKWSAKTTGINTPMAACFYILERQLQATAVTSRQIGRKLRSAEVHR